MSTSTQSATALTPSPSATPSADCPVAWVLGDDVWMIPAAWLEPGLEGVYVGHFNQKPNLREPSEAAASKPPPLPINRVED